MTRPEPSPRAAAPWLALLAAIVFLPGAAGPFVLDDHINLAPVWNWLSGAQEFSEVVFGNRSGPGGRPLAYLSFAFNAALGGDSPVGFKLFNIALHAAVSLLMFAVLRRWLAALSPAPEPSRSAALLTAVWAVHPLHVSTVLYTVQRMTLMSAIAQLCAVWIYLEARNVWTTSPQRARTLVLAAMPLTLAAGVLAKETAILGLLLIAVVEFSLPVAGAKAPRRMLLAMLAVAALLGASWLAMDPDWLARGYRIREFSLLERAASGPRILLEHALGVLWPVPAHLALYRDGYPLSQDWFTPATTWMAALFWIAALAIAAANRKRAPLLLAGLAWFLASHALESTVFPLEPYFEHRNYLASAGIVLAVGGPLFAAFRSVRMRRAAFAAVLVALACSTVARACNWADLDRLLASEGPPAPEISRRLQVDRAIRAYEAGDAAARDAALDVLASGNPGDRTSAALWRLLLACDQPGNLHRILLSGLLQAVPPLATHNHLSALRLVERRVLASQCGDLRAADLAAVVEAWMQMPRTRENEEAMITLARYRSELSASP